MIPGKLYYMWADYDNNEKCHTYLHFFDDSNPLIIYPNQPAMFIEKTLDKRNMEICKFLYQNYYGWIYPQHCQFFEEAKL